VRFNSTGKDFVNSHHLYFSPGIRAGFCLLRVDKFTRVWMYIWLNALTEITVENISFVSK